MKRICLFCILCLGILSINGFAGEVEVKLNDGSVIIGEVIELNNNVYTLKTKSLGQIKINENRIKEIHYKTNESGKICKNPSNAAFTSEIETIRESMMSDEDIMNTIASLQDDPEFQKILQDPEIMNAIQSGNIDSLMSNEKFLNILEHSSVLKIQEDLQESLQ